MPRFAPGSRQTDSVGPQKGVKWGMSVERTSLDDSVSLLLRRAHMRAGAILMDQLEEHHLTQAQYFALARLYEVGRSSQNHLGRIIAMTQNTINGVIQRLHARGLIERLPDHTDRRLIVLQPSAAGRSVIEHPDAGPAKIEESILAPLAPADREHFLRLLKKLT